MTHKNTNLMYFSPTATTRTILEQVAKGIGNEISDVIDITSPEVRNQPSPEFNDSLVLIGAPVYAGRLPEDAARYFKAVRSSGSLAVLVVLYGNREFEDALLELKDIVIKDGFLPVAAGAFIGEHSFTGDVFQIALNRPDEKDCRKAVAFGKQIAELLKIHKNPSEMKLVEVPGDFPYRAGMPDKALSAIEVTKECDACGICSSVCPKNAIDEMNMYATVDEECIYCCACIKACPQNARHLKEGPLRDTAKWLNENCGQRKEPRTFLSGG